MTFVLEAVRTVRGSALILQYGPTDDTGAYILFDCGANGTYEKYLRPRLLQLAASHSAPLHLVLASRTDPAHVRELDRMFRDVKVGLLPIKVERLWLSRVELDKPVSESAETALLIKSAEQLGIEINGSFDGSVIQAETTAHSQGYGLSLEVLAPVTPPLSQAQADPIILARKGDQSILLSGDSPALRITRALINAGYLDQSEAQNVDDPFHVNLMAITQESPDFDLSFFRAVTADSYLFAGNGECGNPNAKILRAIGAARGDDDFNVYFTMTQIPDKHALPFRQAIDDWITSEMPDGCVAHFRENQDASLTTRVELPA